MSILDKMRKARERVVMLDDKIKVTIRRPTDMDALKLQFTDLESAVSGVSDYVVDWEGITELDLIPGGTGSPVPFNRYVFVEWIKDQPELWSVLIDKVKASYEAHQRKKGEELKN